MVSTFRQTRLGLSATGQLSLVMPRSFTAYPDLEPQRRLLESGPNRSKRSAERNTQALILQLPTELLHQCIQAVHDMDLRLSEDPQYYDEYRWGEDDTDDESRQGDHEDFAHNLPQAATKIHIRYAAIYATSLTCKQFHAIAVPMLYARPRFDAPHFEPNLSPQCDKFYGTIQRHSALRPFVKHLALQDKNFHHEYVRKCLRFPNLKSLLLVYPRYEDEDEQGEGPSPEEEGTAALTELRLRHTRIRPPDVKRFLKWPSRLRAFALDDITVDGYDWEYLVPNSAFRWSHALLIDVLSPQRHNLQTLELGWMGYTLDQNQFDVSLYPNLHTLQLCIAYEKPDVVACRNWLTPTLRTIVLDTSNNDSQGGKSSEFRVRKSQTIIHFTKLASAEKKRRPDGVALQEIRFLAYDIGDAELAGDEEWQCDHEGWGDKGLILKTLWAIESYGFSAFWVGASGTKHSAQMIQRACSICANTPNKS